MSQSAGTGAGPGRNPYEAHRHLLRPDEVRDLSRLRVSPPLRDSAVAWMEILAAWMVVAMWPQWWVVLLAIPVIGTANYALHILGHDALHRRYLPDARRNDLVADLLLYGPVAAVTHVTARNHLLHHRRFGSEADPDRYKYATTDKGSRVDLLLYLTGVSNLVPVIRGVFLRRAGDVAGEGERSEFAASGGGGEIGYTARDLAILLGWQLLLLVALSWGIGWWAYPLLWLLPVYVFRYCADEARQFLEHAHLERDGRRDVARLVTYTSNPVERVFFSPLNMNLHTAHHLWPSIPYYNLPRADRMIRERGPASELVWRRSYVGTLLEHLRALPRIRPRAPLRAP